MKILALDSSGMTASVAVLEDDKLLTEFSANYKKTHSQTLLPMLKQAAELVELDLASIDGIAVAAGPGSFTGLRIGSATAKGLGLALNKPIIEVPTLEGLAYNYYGSDLVICPIMDARRGQVYAGIYSFAGKTGAEEFVILEDQEAVSIETLVGQVNDIGRETVFLGDGVPVFKECLLKELKVPFRIAPAHQSLQRAASVAARGMELLREGKTVDAAMHSPDYLRVSQAERERAERINGKLNLQEPSGNTADRRKTDIRIRAMKPSDLEQVLAIERETFSRPWTRQNFLDALDSDFTIYRSVLLGGELVGYCGLLRSADEADITNVAVKKDCRGKGIGEKMLFKLMEAGRTEGISAFTLEVRVSNSAAIHLYEKLGFRSAGIRKNFYDDPKEDACIMWNRPEGEEV